MATIDLAPSGKSERAYRHYTRHMREWFAPYRFVKIEAPYFWEHRKSGRLRGETTVDARADDPGGEIHGELLAAESAWVDAWASRCPDCDGLGDNDTTETWCDCDAGAHAKREL